ncbi:MULTISPECIES: DUF928 domain-containing protein [unclassified Coleofasciculus]|uniref:DUF928 domain-containing protein n=1 Tax=unclassified Coleofasciculus TaxID=2692782 RepID=UPI00188154F5|nr:MULTISPECIES: DUF928 domain-containing protein [unclassified Coleofasciculus]MBE9129478.1 DUF928 domain-containing protein [Coleofasciculus sp. LEGE 07081]MBE9152074.1 DUF928 domain-containing protein [Coleofasciculus sp. LEGE 07092]
MKPSFAKFNLFYSALSAGLAVSISLPAVATLKPTSLNQNSPIPQEILIAQRRSRLRFKVRGVGFSTRRTGAISRGGCTGNSNSQPMKVLLPEFEESDISIQSESTVEANPTFFVHIPETSAPQAEFLLVDENLKPIYDETFQLKGTPTVAIINVPENSEIPSLKVNQKYRWYFSLICDPDDPTSDSSPGAKPTVWGSIKRVEPSDSLANQLETTPPSARPEIFAEAGIWNDALTSLAQLIVANPNDTTLREDWKSLLESVGLGEIAEESLLPLSEVPSPMDNSR